MRVTVNKTKQFCKSNQYWLDYVKYHENGVRRFRKYYDTNTFERDINSLFRNLLYLRAHKEFNYKIGVKDRFTINGRVPTIYRNDIYYTAYAQMDEDGTWRICVTSMHIKSEEEITATFTKNFWLKPYYGNIEHKGIISIESFQKTIEKYYEKFLFPKGWYREYQEMRLLPKKNVINIFKTAHKLRLEPMEYELTTIEKWIKRNFKIDISEVSFEEGVKYAKKHGKQKELVLLQYFPSYEEFFDDFDGDIDDVEYRVNEMLSEYPSNARFI